MRMMHHAVLAAVVALVLSSGSVSARYVQYELFSADGCAAATLIDKGLMGGDGDCVQQSGGFRSRLYRCDGITNYPLTTSCIDVHDPNFPDQIATFQSLGQCTATPGGNTFVRYSCVLGGYAHLLTSSNGDCTNFVNQTQASTYFELNKCTAGWLDESVATTIRSDFLTVSADGTTGVLQEWDNDRNCTGPPDRTSNVTFNQCAANSNVNPDGATIILLTNAAMNPSSFSAFVLAWALAAIAMTF